MRPHQIAALITLSIIWGSAFALVKVVLEEVDPLTLVAGRLAGAAAVLLLILLVMGKRLPLTRASIRAFVLLGVVNTVWPFVLLTWGQERIDSSLAAILTASMPLSTAILARVWLGESLTVERLAGILIGFAGVFLLIGADLRDITDASTLGQLAVIVGVLGYSFGIVYGRQYLQHADATETATGQMLVGALVMVPLAIGVEHPFPLSISPKVAFAWASLAVFASAIAYLIYFPFLRSVTAAQASMVGYLIPITAVLIGAVFLDERLGATSFLGLGLIIAGVWTVNGGATWLLARVRSPQTFRNDDRRIDQQRSQIDRDPY